MQVVLKPSVIDAIHKRLAEAERQYRKVDHIIVTPEEFNEIKYMTDVRVSFLSPLSKVVDPYMTFKTIELKHPTKVGQRMRFASHETLFGHPLYVVPAEFTSSHDKQEF